MSEHNGVESSAANAENGGETIRLIIKGLAKSYTSGNEEIHVLRNVNLSLAEGQSVAIVGTSGCGKSTLLNLIGGLDKVSAGQIECCGYRLNELSESHLNEYRARSIGFVFQFHYLLKDFSALENVMLPMVMTGLKRNNAKKIAREVLNNVGLDKRLNHYPVQLSGGECQRVALARALVNSPDIILADEPTGNLDEENKKLVADTLFKLVNSMGRSLVLVTHATDLASSTNLTLRLKEGELITA